MDIIAIAFGGVIGALLRYYLILLVTLYFKYPVFYGTFFVNITGSFLVGFLAYWFQGGDFSLFPWDKLTMVGFLGAYTTFSSYILDTMNLWRSQQYKVALGYCLTSLILGFFIAELGVFIYLFLQPFS